MDRNEVIKWLHRKAICAPTDGQSLISRSPNQDKTYRPCNERSISAMTIYKDQFVMYLDDKAVKLSNAWQVVLYLKHELPKAKYNCQQAAIRSFLIM